MAECEKRRFFSFRLSMPRLPMPRLSMPHIPLLTWRPKLGRSRKQQQTYASATVAMTESVLSSSSSAAQQVTKVPLKPASDVLAGALARAASQSTIHPLDTLKVRLQTQGAMGMKSSSGAGGGAGVVGVSKFGKLVPPPMGKGILSFGSSAGTGNIDIGKMGLAVGGLYRGVLGAASGAGIAIGAYFAFYGAACNIISRRTDLSPTGVAFVSGGIAAAGSSFIKVPLAVCIRSVQAGVYNNVFHAAKSITTACGPRGLFTGFLPTVLEDVPDMAIKFAAYESLRSLHSHVYGRPANISEDFAMGAVSGAAAAAATTPVDVIKTNMMISAASRPTMASAAKMVFDNGGHKAFFRGLGARALSNGMNSAVFFVFFEALRTHFKVKAAAAEAAAALLVVEPLEV